MIAGEPVWMRMIKDLLREIRERYHLNLIDLDRKNQEFKKASVLTKKNSIICTPWMAS